MTPRARTTTLVSVAVAFGMLGLAFASAPLYDMFCKVTGFGGTTKVAAQKSDRVTDRPVRIRFDANVDPSLDLVFKPETPFVDAMVGQNVLSYYVVENRSPDAVRATAGYNVAPFKAGKYFEKIECFCFKERTFQPGHSERLPVFFYVSPDMVKDKQARDVQTITLSYTYYPLGGIPPVARLEDASALQ